MKYSFRFLEQVFLAVKLNPINILFMKLFHFRTPTFANLHFFVYKGLKGGNFIEILIFFFLLQEVILNISLEKNVIPDI